MEEVSIKNVGIFRSEEFDFIPSPKTYLNFSDAPFFGFRKILIFAPK